MKTLVIAGFLLVLAAAVRAGEHDIYADFLKDTFAKCGADNGVTDDEIKNFVEGGPDKDPKKMGCFKACVLKTHDMMKDGKVDMDMVVTFLELVHVDDPDPIASAKEIATRCTEKTKDVTDECELANVFISCNMSKDV